MTFSDPLFYLIFLPSALIGFQLLGRFGRRSAIGFLAFASIYFYSAIYFYSKWDLSYVLFLLASVLANYFFSIAIAQSAKHPKLQSFWLTAGVATNLAALCYFKYLFPLLKFLAAIGVARHDWGSVILPLGISFFTFTQIAYLVDLKQGMAERQSLLSYTLFVTFFPHLIAGPIIHHKEMMPQFSQERRYQLNRSDMAVGLTWFTMGFFKKVMIADRISPVADAFFKQPQGAGALQAWLGVLTYSMQLYFDFSGYSDMALGLARMFSIHFPLNFNSPYKASSMIDFWQRWHMTLTRYIMYYVFSPVQLYVSARRFDRGKKITRKAMATPDGFRDMVAMPTLFTMFLAGVWHGAGLQFLVFGLAHGTYLVVNHAWRIFVPQQSPLRKPFILPVNIGITFLAVLVAEVLFRANSLGSAGQVLATMAGAHGLGPAWPATQLLIIPALLGIVWLMPNTQEILGETQKDDEPNWSIVRGVRWQPTFAWGTATSAAFAISMFFSTANTTFLYFQF